MEWAEVEWVLGGRVPRPSESSRPPGPGAAIRPNKQAAPGSARPGLSRLGEADIDGLVDVVEITVNLVGKIPGPRIIPIEPSSKPPHLEAL